MEGELSTLVLQLASRVERSHKKSARANRRRSTQGTVATNRITAADEKAHLTTAVLSAKAHELMCCMALQQMLESRAMLSDLSRRKEGASCQTSFSAERCPTHAKWLRWLGGLRPLLELDCDVIW
jgi:hypothetical protein